MARRIKRTIQWDGDYGHRNPTTEVSENQPWPDGRYQDNEGEFNPVKVLRAHGGDLEFKVEKYKGFYVLSDCRDAVDENGEKNHWAGAWTIGCKTKAQCRRAAEVLLTDGFEAMYREFNSAMAETFDDIRAAGKEGPHYGWPQYNEVARPEMDVEEALAYLREKAYEGAIPTLGEVQRALRSKYGFSGRTSRLFNKVLMRITVRYPVEAFAV